MRFVWLVFLFLVFIVFIWFVVTAVWVWLTKRISEQFTPAVVTATLHTVVELTILVKITITTNTLFKYLLNYIPTFMINEKLVLMLN